jgi:hypothetical protein
MRCTHVHLQTATKIRTKIAKVKLYHINFVFFVPVHPHSTVHAYVGSQPYQTKYPSSTMLLDVFSELSAYVHLLKALPIAPVEPRHISILADEARATGNGTLGHVCAPFPLSANALMLCLKTTHASPGSTAVFAIRCVFSSSFPGAIAALASLAMVVQVRARYFPAAGGEVPDKVVHEWAEPKDIPVTLELSPTRQCIDVMVAVPRDAPPTSRVEVVHVCVAGCDILLDPSEAAAWVYNHAPAPAGPAIKAAASGDAAALVSALHEGHSTEERDGVSRVIVCMSLTKLQLTVSVLSGRVLYATRSLNSES